MSTDKGIVLLCLAFVTVIYAVYIIADYINEAKKDVLKGINRAHKQNYLFFKQLNPAVDIKKNKPVWVEGLEDKPKPKKGEAYNPNRDHMTFMDGSRSEMFEGDEDEDMFD